MTGDGNESVRIAVRVVVVAADYAQMVDGATQGVSGARRINDAKGSVLHDDCRTL